MTRALIRCLFVAGCLSSGIQAATFILEITSTNASIGTLPSGPLAGLAGPVAIDLTPGVPGSWNLNNYTNFFYPGGGPPHTGATATVTQTVTVNGVSVNVNRTLTLIAAPSPGFDCANTVIGPSAQVTVDLGASGKVDVSLPALGFAGEACNGGVVLSRGIVVIPSQGPNAILLHDVPGQSPAIPLPPTLILSLTGLAGAGLYEVRRRIRARNFESFH